MIRSESASGAAMFPTGLNPRGVWALYLNEMSRTARTILQSVATPVITTALYFVVFGSAIGSRMREVGGVSYGAFIVPGLIMLSLLTQSISNASIGIYFPKFTGAIFEILSALALGDRSRRGLWAGAACHQIDRHRPHHPGDRGTVHALARSTIRDSGWLRLPRPDLDRLQPLWPYHRDLGEEFRTTGDHPVTDRDPADLPRR